MQMPFHKNCGKHPENRWFYKRETKSCALFTYTGCQGNDNNFETELSCLESCSSMISFCIQIDKIQKSLSLVTVPAIDNSLRSYSLLGHEGSSNKVDCKVTHWKQEPCNATCGEGFRWKYRSIIVRIHVTSPTNIERNES